ncbi:DUF4386 domain-containing protein [Pseudarthrobacter sulfonivorans]|uniref:DUF4386 domain-containing protein n=1 Tax=Pseudarthrobacter sulfonivorans TaxID=121292 RepID=UPI0027840C51|nr:DUF4386 domain-containing protein [Pseudarthrobacter sulfonivorans]MDP9999593.1 intracellular septation protein A [Pseudarthrobacter sulfonivorans]
MSTFFTTRTATSQRPSKLDFRDWSPASASLISGLALLAMVVLMTAGYFGGVTPLITPGDATKTAQDISQSAPIYLAGVACIFLVILLDVPVAGAWYALFKNVNRRLSAAAAWMRVTFAGIFAIATSQLAYAYTLLDDPDRALHAIESFRTIWLISLGLFGLYLIAIGYLELRSTFVPKIFGILLAISGIGYITDALGVALVDGFTPMYGLFAIIGETSCIFWLLIKGRKLTIR